MRIYKRFPKDANDFHENIKQKIKEFFLVLEENPVPRNAFDIAKIGGKEATYRCRIGYARILYEVFWNEKIIQVIRAERKSDSTYKKI